MGGHRPRVLAGERDWLLARLAEKPDLTLRALVAELVERGVPASYGAVWRLLKDRPAPSPPNPPTWRQWRGISAARRSPAGPMEEVPGAP